MRRALRLVTALTLTSLVAAASASAEDPRLTGSYKFNDGGWTYVHLQGSPGQVGFQHGYLLAREIEDNVHVYQVEAIHEHESNWTDYRTMAQRVFWPKIEPEYQQEIKGIVEGLRAHGSKLDLWDVVALNAELEIGNYYLPTLNNRKQKANAAKNTAPGKCSAFIATGSATTDGRIVIAHSNWSSYAEGERWRTVFDIVPAGGQHLIMDGLPGVITSRLTL